MKNILVYTNPAKKFHEENVPLIKIHIDNSLELGWHRPDILLFTNFEYEYHGVKAKVVSDSLQCTFDKTSNKIIVINDLLQKGLLQRDLYWYHDFDAYQNNIMTESELGLEEFDLGLTGYEYKPQWNGGSFFFKRTAKSIFKMWAENLVKINRTRADEKTMTDMTRDGSMKPFKYKEMNITYNFGQRCPKLCYEIADKPLKVLHFHPYYKFYPKDCSNIDVFMHGKNKHNIPMMSKRLIKLFKKYGIQ